MFYVQIFTKDGFDSSKLYKIIQSDLKITHDIDNASGLIVIGGDGTLLKTLRALNRRILPKIYTINFGLIGCLLLNDKSKTVSLIKMIANNHDKLCTLSRKRLLIKNNGYFLNEVILTNRIPGRLNSFEIHIDDQPLIKVKCDSIIVSTPSGSSAYNLSAGGPLVDNKCDCIIINAVSPFKTCFKNYIVNINSKIKVEIITPGYCIIDGFDIIDNCNLIEVEYDGNYLDFAYIKDGDSVDKKMFDKIFGSF